MNPPRVFLLLFLSLLVLTTVGCEILTREQVKAVERFASAAKPFDTLPGEIIRGYRDILGEARRMGAMASNDDPARALEKVQRSVQMSSALGQQADRADQAVAILGTYTELLVLLTSEEYTRELEASAKNLGAEIDSAVADYKENAPVEIRGNLDSVGSMAAAVVRAVGGIIIKRRQAKALRNAVADADPLVAALTDDTVAFAGDFVESEEGLDHVGAALEDYTAELEELLAAVDVETRLELLDNAGVVMRRAAQLRALAARCKVAAMKYKEAHAQMKKVVSEKTADESGRKRLDLLISQVRSLAEEVKAAQKLKKELDK